MQAVMRRLRHHPLHYVRVFFVIALTLVPLALSGHLHITQRNNTPDVCAACVVKHQSRSTSLSPLPISGPILTRFEVVESIAAAPAHVSLPFRTGRAPPSCSLFA